MFENGLDTIDADLLFASYRTLLGLEYWAWVKNQAIEKTFDYDGRLLNPCHIEIGLIGTTDPPSCIRRSRSPSRSRRAYWTV